MSCLPPAVIGSNGGGTQEASGGKEGRSSMLGLKGKDDEKDEAIGTLLSASTGLHSPEDRPPLSDRVSYVYIADSTILKL